MNGVDIFLSKKEARRVYVIEQVIQSKLTISQASQILGLSERQVQRLKKGVMTEGVAFLAHKNRGRKPKHTIPKEVRDTIISLALDPNKYQNASCQQMSELLARYQNITVSARSIRRILTEAGIPLFHAKKHTRRRRSRDRMPSFGMLAQCDASPFTWFESRGPLASLHGAIDDATGKVLGLFFRPTEDLIGYLQVLRQIITNHGTPLAIYSDRHTIFFSPNKDKLSIEDELAGKKVPLTQFGQALSELGISHIPALSPQAKGRVERLWGTLQGRLLIELRIAGISTIDEANAFLPGFISRFNERFAVDPEQSQSAFRPSIDKDLDLILCRKDSRKASSGSTISYLNKTYQLTTPNGVLPLRPRSTVTVLTHLDGSLSALYGDKLYGLKECKSVTRKETISLPKTKTNPKKHTSPPATHPWRKPFPLTPPKEEPSTSYWREKIYRGKIYAER